MDVPLEFTQDESGSASFGSGPIRDECLTPDRVTTPERETARAHHASRRRGDRMAARGAVTADGAMLVIGSAPET